MADGKSGRHILGAEEACPDWVAQLGESLRVDEVPAGYKSIVELSAELGCPLSTLRQRLRKMVDNGELEKIMCRHEVEGGARRMAFYGPPRCG